ncbi:MAG: peptidoglycan DD-metalloendopeptidase family protein [Pseudomonadota bacterium]|nr:peptidoglycan DD-metalloendopeptidase family protein [Pseudomonadota bacterium]
MLIRRRQTHLCLLLAASLAPAPARAVDAADRAGMEMQLRGVETNLKATDEERRKIEADVEAIKLDRARLNEALLETTARLQKIESDRAEASAQLAQAATDATRLEASFGERRQRIGELMAALQRMTHDAPPAIFVRPDDMAAAVRAASVVNALLGDIKSQADGLSRDMKKVEELKRTITQKRDELAANAEELAVDKERLAALVEARQKALGDRQSVLDEERKRSDQLASQALNLKDLIAKMDGEAAAAAAADRAAARTVESRAAMRGGDLARLKPATPFSDDKGRLAWPVAGKPVKNFGDPDGLGGESKGVSVAAPPGATVSAPADAWVAYAGPYRSYGQLLILNAGEGYYILLAGMERIQVAVGQFVLAGEPVAVMGSGARQASASAKAPAPAIGADQTVLYIEFRKNDTILDPQPWWAKSNLEKARG